MKTNININKEKVIHFLRKKLNEDTKDVITLNQFQTLRSLMNNPFLVNEIGKGSIFETESSLFVVGMKLPSMKYYGKHVIGLTTDSPLYKLFKNKKNGEEVLYGNDIEHIEII